MTPRAQDLDWTIERLETELAYRRAKQSLTFARPGPDERARHLLSFVLHNMPQYIPGWVHVYICEVLEQFVRDIDAGKNPRLILTMPPRHGKSEIVSRNLPVWYLGNHPNHEVVVATYGQELADKMSNRARAYRDNNLDIFPHLAKNPRKGAKDGVQFWEVAGEGSYNAVGAGGPLTGSGFHLGIIDDPVKNAEDADSPTKREKVWDWYQSTFYTRAAPGAGILVMATRWHEDDLIGRLLADDPSRTKGADGDEWQVIDFPAIAEVDEHHPVTGALFRAVGEALHPERYPVERLRKIRRAVGERWWNALYRCQPTSATGNIFKKAWYPTRHRWDPALPPVKFDETAITIDANFIDETSSTPAVLGYWGRIGWSRKIRLDERRGQFSWRELRQHAHHLGLLYNPTFFLVEQAANGYALIEDLRELGWTVLPFKPAEYGSKAMRAELAATTHAGLEIELVEADWTDEWINEHTGFPFAKYRDRVDASSQLMVHWQGRQRIGETNSAVREANSILSEVLGGLR